MNYELLNVVKSLNLIFKGDFNRSYFFLLIQNNTDFTSVKSVLFAIYVLVVMMSGLGSDIERKSILSTFVLGRALRISIFLGTEK